MLRLEHWSATERQMLADMISKFEHKSAAGMSEYLQI